MVWSADDAKDAKRRMNEQDRHAAILAMLSTAQFASINDIVSRLHVSYATVRRDISKLDQAGAVRKVHGGLTRIESGGGLSAIGRPYRENQAIQTAQKHAIALEARRLCHDGDTIFIHGGTSCSIFADQLSELSLRIFTNSVPVAESIWTSSTCHLHLLGGDLHREPAIFYSTELWEEEFYVSKYFLGTLGIGPDGLLENNPLLVRVIDMVVGRASEVVVLADSSKFGVRARLKALPFDRIGTLITDDGVSDGDAKMVEDAGVHLIVARRGTDQPAASEHEPP